MPKVSFSQEDILSNAELEAGWYPMSLQAVSEGPGKNDPSATTYTCKFEIVDGPKKGAQLDYWFSTKMPKNSIRYFLGLGVKPGTGVEYDFQDTVGRPVMGYVVYDIERGANTIKDFKPVGR